jgi:hypothetical protein
MEIPYSQPQTATACFQTHDCLKVKVTLQLTVSLSWCRGPSGSHDHILISVWNLLFYQCRAPPLTRGQACHLYYSPELLQFSNFAAGLCQLLYLGLPSVCLLHIEEAQAIPPRQGSSPWGGWLSGCWPSLYSLGVGRIENTASNSSAVVACWFVAAETCSLHHCLAMAA